MSGGPERSMLPTPAAIFNSTSAAATSACHGQVPTKAGWTPAVLTALESVTRLRTTQASFRNQTKPQNPNTTQGLNIRTSSRTTAVCLQATYEWGCLLRMHLLSLLPTLLANTGTRQHLGWHTAWVPPLDALNRTTRHSGFRPKADTRTLNPATQHQAAAEATAKQRTAASTLNRSLHQPMHKQQAAGKALPALCARVQNTTPADTRAAVKHFKRCNCRPSLASPTGAPHNRQAVAQYCQCALRCHTHAYIGSERTPCSLPFCAIQYTQATPHVATQVRVFPRTLHTGHHHHWHKLESHAPTTTPHHAFKGSDNCMTSHAGR